MAYPEPENPENSGEIISKTVNDLSVCVVFTGRRRRVIDVAGVVFWWHLVHYFDILSR